MQDELGLEHTTRNADALKLLADALEEYLASTAATLPALEKVLQADPDLPMGMLMRAYLLKLAADPRFRQPIEMTVAALAARDLNQRERRHLHALELWQQDRLEQTASAFDAIATDYPRDLLALRAAHYLHFYTSGGPAMRTSLAGAINAWSPGERYYGYLKGMESFALEESGDFEAAEASGRQAIEHNRGDIWAAHAVAHVYQMQGRFSEGIRFIESLSEAWAGANNFVNHMHWHKALQFIGNGDLKAAVELYDNHLTQPLADDFYLDVCNAASLLWRFDMLGISTGDRWQQLIEYARARAADDELVFSSLHYLMALALAGDTTAARDCLQHFETWAARDSSQGLVARDAGLPMARAILMIAEGRYRDGARQLQAVRQNIQLIGGSHAQRDLFTQVIDRYQAA